MFAIKHYDNPQAVGEKEFYDDMKRFKGRPVFLSNFIEQQNFCRIWTKYICQNNYMVHYETFFKYASFGMFLK